MIELKTHKENVYLCTIYRPPNSNEKKLLKNYRQQLKKLSPQQLSRLVIGIDHNLDFLKHDKHRPTHEFIEENLEHQLIPIITKATRITRTTATLIDNIIVGRDFQTSLDPSIVVSDISDHYPCLLKIHDETLFKKQPKRVETRKLDQNKIGKINNRLSMVEWEKDLDNLSIDNQYKVFHSSLITIMDEEAPYQTITIPSNKIIRDPWLISGLMKCFTKQRTLYKATLHRTSGDIAMLRYKTYRNKLKEIVRRAKENFFKNKCNEFRRNRNRLWKLVNKLASKPNDKTSIVEYLRLDNQDIYEDKVIAEEFAKHFSTVGREYSNKFPHHN